MSRRPDPWGHTSRRYLVKLVVATLATFLLATAAYAALSSISPSRGTVAPGESTTATFQVSPSLLSCVVANVSPNPGNQIAVSFDAAGLDPANCTALGGDLEVEMTVTAKPEAKPGDYIVTINEVALLGGSLLDSLTWPFTVLAPATTTTTTSTTTTTTTAPTTTTTAPPTTTSTQSATTTSTRPSATTTSSPVTTTSTATATTESTTSATGSTATPSTDQSPPSEESPDDEQVVAAGAPDDNLPYDRYPSESGDAVARPQSRTALSDQLRSQISGAVPLTVADAVLSPLVITEFLFGALLDGAKALAIPLVISTLVGLWMVLRMREEVDDDELTLSRQSVV